jgi:hypothetical protein
VYGDRTLMLDGEVPYSMLLVAVDAWCSVARKRWSSPSRQRRLVPRIGRYDWRTRRENDGGAFKVCASPTAICGNLCLCGSMEFTLLQPWDAPWERSHDLLNRPRLFSKPEAQRVGGR